MTTFAAAVRTTTIATLVLSMTAADAHLGKAHAKTPLEAVEAAEKGQLKNPYSGDAAAAEEGHKLYMSAGCHGGTGGGGMGPPLTNQVWVYGDDDDTLFRLITLGSDDLQAAGYSRVGTENVVGPMPHAKDIVKSEDDMWKIVTWIKSLHGGG